MNIYQANYQRIQPPQSRLRVVCRCLLIDVLPTLFLLLIMAFGMLLVARYAESSHIDLLQTDDQIAQSSVLFSSMISTPVKAEPVAE